MSVLDYAVMLGTLLFIAAYGTWKTRVHKDIKGYLLGNKELGWGTIGLSVMATQASAVTFLSVPGQAYESGMAFVQNYFGMPLALIVVSAVFIPLYYRLKVFTAYEFLEKRFDLKSRLLAAALFLVQRGLAAGITIYAPAIVLSSVLGWNLSLTIVVVGVVVVVYTVSGGTRAVSITQKWQMSVILLGMAIAFGMVVRSLPANVDLWTGLQLAGKVGKTQAVNFSFDLKERYTFWSGLLGGFFLSLSYFGTDQSQVQRYIGGKSIRESRMGLMFNAVLKIPMQFFILLTGVMVYVFFIFQPHDVLFDGTSVQRLEQSSMSDSLAHYRALHYGLQDEKRRLATEMALAIQHGDDEAVALLQPELLDVQSRFTDVRNRAKGLVKRTFPEQKQPDSDYVFITYVLRFMPVGLVGLLVAIILAAAMSSTAGELNALGSTATVDFYKRLVRKDADDRHYVRASKWLTALWGALALGFALFAEMLENLIEAVNILGSLFYGTILGIFVVAFFLKFINGRQVFIAAIAAQASVLVVYWAFGDSLSYLLFNPLGCALVMLFGSLLYLAQRKKAP
jgi:Na+/proline symporter